MPLSIQPPRLPEESLEKKPILSFLRKPSALDQEASTRSYASYEEEQRFVNERTKALDKKEQIIRLKEETYKKEIENLEEQRRKLEQEVQDRRAHVKQFEQELEERQGVLWQK